MKKFFFPVLIFYGLIMLNSLNIFAQSYDNNLDIAYNYLNSGLTDQAISLFESHLKEYPGDVKVCMQLAYAYKQIGNKEKAEEYFKIVSQTSSDENEIKTANNELTYINSNPANQDNDNKELQKAYDLINQKKYKEAIDILENYKKQHPEDIKIDLQLAYLYSNEKIYDKALDKFEIVSGNSKNDDDVDASMQSIYYVKDMLVQNSAQSLNIYSYNDFDTYFNNYVTSFVGHVNFKLSKRVFTGFYLDYNFDTRTTKQNIYNDRYVEGGQFFKYVLSDNLGFEFRTGYVREFDFDKNGVNFKPILYGGTRIGNPSIYFGTKSSQTDFFYLDIYAMTLYDYKFRNFFGQLLTKEVLRSMSGDYSYFEFYLKQLVNADNQQLDFNNYIEAGFGVSYQPNLINFPSLFLEATNKTFFIGPGGNYFQGPLRNTFQFKAGILVNFNSTL